MSSGPRNSRSNGGGRWSDLLRQVTGLTVLWRGGLFEQVLFGVRVREGVSKQLPRRRFSNPTFEVFFGRWTREGRALSPGRDPRVCGAGRRKRVSSEVCGRRSRTWISTVMTRRAASRASEVSLRRDGGSWIRAPRLAGLNVEGWLSEFLFFGEGTRSVEPKRTRRSVEVHGSSPKGGLFGVFAEGSRRGAKGHAGSKS